MFSFRMVRESAVCAWPSELKKQRHVAVAVTHRGTLADGVMDACAVMVLFFLLSM
jgi:hypothetical protein